MSSESDAYDAKFYRELQSTGDSAREILPIVIEVLHPSSMVDIGCGAGYWLAEAMQLGIADVLGVEGEWINRTRIAVPREKLRIHDLTKPLDLGRKFDLALSLEVAEHLPADSARPFVKALSEAADRVLFSAAIPGQGGRRHLNEQWPGYWAALFDELGYECYDLIRRRVWENPRVLWYYAQNCLLYVRRGTAVQPGNSGPPQPLVHPVAWSAQIARWNSPGKLLEHLPKVLLGRFGI